MTKTTLPKLTIAETDRVHNFKTHQSWAITNPERFNQLMDEATTLVQPGFILGDNLFTWGRNMSALEDQAFMHAWQSNITNAADEAILWRRYILCCAAYHCIHLEGDFVECGVLHGTAVKTVIDYFGKENFHKNFWAYDTYESNPTDHVFEQQKEGFLKKIKERFAGYNTVKLVQGLLPESLTNNSPDKIAYMHIDMNSAVFEVAVLEVLFDRVVPGGIIIFDDYEWCGAYRGQKIAEDTWFDARNYRVFPLPTGQGLVIKR